MRDDVRAASLELAYSEGYPVVAASGSGYVHDARCAWLVDALDAFVVAQQVPRVRPGWFSASALGQSDEELIAAYRGEPGERFDAQKLRVFSVGNDRDATYKRWLQESGLSAVGSDEDRKVKIPHLRLQGECDDILRSPTGFTVFEMKTIYPFQFGKLTEPLPAHSLQVCAYMAGLALRDAIVCYENKATQQLRLFYVPFDQEVWDGICERLRRLRKEADPSG